MGILNIRENEDPVLRVVCKEVKEVTPRILELIDDMFETMYDAEGVGLAAPQVGIRKRFCVIDVGTPEEPDPLLLINPVLLEEEGEQTGREGCLSVPDKYAIVKRPEHIKIKAFDREMKEFTLEAYALKARCILHEMDHLDGILYIDKAIGGVHDINEEPEEEE